MPKKIVNIHAAKNGLSRLVARPERGKRSNIALAGKPVAQLGPAPRRTRSQLLLDDPLLRVDEYGFDGPVSKLTNADIDRTVYGL